MAVVSVHDRVDPKYSFPEFYDLPPRLQDLMHRCPNYSALPVTQYKKGPPICGSCAKIVPWFFFKCIKCDEHFIQDFRHPKFCNFYPTCWEHTLELEWDYCATHKADPNEFEFFAQIVEPRGLNPRNFTDAELENVFDF